MPGFLEPGGTGTRLGRFAIVFAGVCSLIATLLSIFSIWLQLKNYRKPLLQRYVVRILVMVPIYAIASWLSLISLSAAFFLDPIREIYEAFTIYTFFQLLINFLGGERSLIILTHGRAPTQHLFPVDLCLPAVDISDPHTFLNLKRGILQYAWLKPFLATSILIMKATDTYQEGYIGLTSGYFWSGILYNVSVTVSLYSLGMFWACMSKDLKPFRPMPKFLCIKLIIFASYWQGCFLAILVWLKAFDNVSYYTPDNLAAAIQDCLICCELPAFAMGHWYAFSWKDYADPSISAARMPVRYAFRDAFGIRDLVHDTKSTFAGKGYDYRNFDSAGDTTMVHADSAARMGRMMDGMRYERGGKGKYWIPKPTPSSRTALLAPSVGAVGGLADDPANRAAAGVGKSYGSTKINELDDISTDDEAETLYKNARTLEFGDWNYPVITAYEPIGDHRCSLNNQPEFITTSTNQALLKPGARKTRQSRSRSRRRAESRSRSAKGKGRASSDDDDSDTNEEDETEAEPQGLLAKVTNVFHRTKSDSSHSSEASNRSGLVDLVVEDTEAEEIERVRARKEGGAGGADEDPKIYVSLYHSDEEEEVEYQGIKSDGIPPSVDSRDPKSEEFMENGTDENAGDSFVVAEEDEEDGEAESPQEDREPRFGSLAEDNPWSK